MSKKDKRWKHRRHQRKKEKARLYKKGRPKAEVRPMGFWDYFR